jgi:hypothetical protein
VPGDVTAQWTNVREIFIIFFQAEVVVVVIVVAVVVVIVVTFQNVVTRGWR